MHLVSQNCFCLRMSVCMCVCLPLRLLITSSMMWCDIETSYNWLNNFYGFYVAVVIDIVSRRDISIDMCCGNQPNISNPTLYKPLLHCNNHLKQLQLSNKVSASVIKVGVIDVDMHISSHLKEELAWSIDKRLRVISTKMLQEEY